MKKISIKVIVFTALGTTCLLSDLSAASGTWTGGSDGIWTNTGNWSVSPVPGVASVAANTETATFNNNVNTTITVDATRYMGGLVFNPGAGAFTFNSGTFFFSPSGTGGVGDDIVVNSGVTNDQIINSNIEAYRTTAGTNMGFTNNSSTANLIINGTVTGNGAFAGIAASPGPPVVVEAAPTSSLNLTGSGNGIINGVIANGNVPSPLVSNVNLSLLKSGSGTWTLSGANTYTGSTTLGDGGLTLNFSGSSSPVSNIVASTSSLLLGRGSPGVAGSRTLTVAGKADTANTQTFNGFTLGVGANHLVLSTSGSGSMTVNLGLNGNASRTSGSTLDIVAPVGTLVTTTTLNNATTGTLPQATTLNGTDFARNDGLNNVVAYSTYTANTATTLGTSTQVVDMSGGNTALSANTTVGALRFNNNSSNTITLDAGRILTIGGASAAGSILNTANVGANNSTIAGGILSGNSGRDLVLLQNNPSGDLVINSAVTSHNSGSNSNLGLTKSGVGTAILNGQNTFGGVQSYINEGTLVVTADATVGNTQLLTTTASTTVNGVNTTGLFVGQRVTGTTVASGQGSFITGIGANSITLSVAATAGTTNLSFSNSGGLGIFTGPSAVLVGSGATLQIGNGGTTGSLVSGQGISNSGTVAFNRSDTSTYSNFIYGSGSVVQDGTGTTVLPSTQFYTGDTIVNDGVLQVDGDTVAAQTGGTGTRVQGSPVITGMNPATVANLRVGQTFTGGSGITTGSIITSIDSTTQITMNNNASSNNTSANLAFVAGGGLGAGGAVTVNGGTLLIGTTGSVNSNSMITINTGGHFKYNSSTALTAPLTINGGKVSGSGTLNVDLALNNIADTLSPGNSAGPMPLGTSQNWSALTYEWEINDWTGGVAATDFDQITIAGSLTLNNSNLYAFDVLSLLPDNTTPGAVSNFGESNQSWIVLTTSGGITGFNASNWTVDATGFTNAETGAFTLNQVGDNLVLSYGVIPEPSTYAMLMGGLGLLALLRRRSKS